MGPGRSPAPSSGPHLPAPCGHCGLRGRGQVHGTLTRPGPQPGGSAGAPPPRNRLPSLCPCPPPPLIRARAPGLRPGHTVCRGRCLRLREVPTARALLGRALRVLGVTCARAHESRASHSLLHCTRLSVCPSACPSSVPLLARRPVSKSHVSVRLHYCSLQDRRKHPTPHVSTRSRSLPRAPRTRPASIHTGTEGTRVRPRLCRWL